MTISVEQRKPGHCRIVLKVAEKLEQVASAEGSDRDIHLEVNELPAGEYLVMTEPEDTTNEHVLVAYGASDAHFEESKYTREELEKE